MNTTSRFALTFHLAVLTLCLLQTVGATRTMATDIPAGSGNSAPAAASYKWNIDERDMPLLNVPEDQLKPGLDELLTFPLNQLDFPVFKPLSLDEGQSKYLLPALSKETRSIHFIEFAPTGAANNYVSIDGSNIQFIDNDSLKTFRTPEGTKYLFVRYPDGEFRCATIRRPDGATLNFLYAANGLALHGVVDSTGRSVTFNYSSEGISSLTQNWMANSTGVSRTWTIDVPAEKNDGAIKYSHAVGIKSLKFLPANAVIHEYTPEMEASDKRLAQIFGGPDAVAGGNGFEPPGLGSEYPLYRGDIIGDDGKLRAGHLSHAVHLYGSPDGRGDSPLYVPAGFTSHSAEPSPTDAAVLFYYPKLGNLTDVTLAVFHVANFQLTAEGDRVRIGNIGGPGGSSPLYKHSHIDFYRGNTPLPPAAARAALRIDPATVFEVR